MPVRGMRDFLPEDKAHREKVLNLLRQTYTSRGFQELETPAMEVITRLKSGQGGENESMLFEIMRRGLPHNEAVLPAEATDMGMRYDLTLPLSRYYATHQAELPQVFRAFQTGPVWRAERPQKGRFRQFNQCDIDIIGAGSYSAEVEVLATAWTAMQALGLAEKSCILINDRRLLNALMTACDVKSEQAGATLIILDKLDKIGAEKVVEELVEKLDFTPAQAETLLAVVAELEGYDIAAIGSQDSSQDSPATLQLEQLAQAVELYDLPLIMRSLKEIHPEISIRFAPSLVRGMGYYTGTIFEVVHSDFGSSICGGGRYDGVIGRWLGKDVPAVGFSFGFERIVDLVKLEEDTAQVKLALAASKDHEALAALKIREKLATLEQVERVGLVKAPRKINARFFEEVAAQGYNRILLPSAYLESEDLDTLLEKAKLL